MYFVKQCSSPLGGIRLASDGERLIGLWLEEQKYFCDSVKGEEFQRRELPIFDRTSMWLDRYFAGERPKIGDLPLAPRGSEFRQEIWRILCEIPYGETTTYGAIAKRMAAKMKRDTMSAQAVGGAVSHNPISIIIPCHRVLGAGGSLTGYAGGIDKKIWLLEHEQQ